MGSIHLSKIETSLPTHPVEEGRGQEAKVSYIAISGGFRPSLIASH
jgi:hypothetical protein